MDFKLIGLSLLAAVTLAFAFTALAKMLGGKAAQTLQATGLFIVATSILYFAVYGASVPTGGIKGIGWLLVPFVALRTQLFIIGGTLFVIGSVAAAIGSSWIRELIAVIADRRQRTAFNARVTPIDINRKSAFVHNLGRKFQIDKHDTLMRPSDKSADDDAREG